MESVAADIQFHVLAVDDSILDRKLIERLLKTSSYHGMCLHVLALIYIKVVFFIWFVMILMFECSWVFSFLFFTVTAVDSGIKALEFLGLQRDAHVTKDLSSVALNHFHQVSNIALYLTI